MNPISLSAEHYASKWKIDAAPRPHAEINALAKRYAETHDQDALLCLCEAFHPYLMKYLVMIRQGHIPVIGVGRNPYFVNPDTAPFLKYFLPKGHELTRKNLQKVVKHFHLAFKGMELEEIYDVLMEQLVAAINGYDPCYKAKVKKVIEVIDHELSKRKQFRALDVRRRLGFDCDKHLRLLCRRGFLEVVPGREEEKGSCFQRLVWPPPVEFTEGDGDVIGLAYYLQKWFRFGLQEWISKRSRELESKEGVYSLEDWNLTRASNASEDSVQTGGNDNALAEQVVAADGDYRNDRGTALSSDVSMMRKPLDVSQMTSNWV